MTEVRKYLTWLGIIVILLVALAGSVVLKDRFGTVQNSNEPTTTESVEFTPEQPGHIYSYEYVSNYDQGEEWNEENTDGKIVRTDLGTKEKVTVVSSVKKAYLDPERGGGQSFYQVTTSPNKPYLYLSNSFIEGAIGLIRYDGSANTFKKMESYFDISASSFPPVGRYIVTIQSKLDEYDGNKLYLIDLDEDKIELLAELPTEQTFNICKIEGCLGSTGINANWLDKDTFTINVYDSKPGPVDPQTGGPKAILIETRKFNINK